MLILQLMHYFIHGKIYFIVDEIDSCETIYSTKEGGPEHTAFIMPKLIYLYYHRLRKGIP